jgi:hypothetical protein
MNTQPKMDGYRRNGEIARMWREEIERANPGFGVTPVSPTWVRVWITCKARVNVPVSRIVGTLRPIFWGLGYISHNPYAASSHFRAPELSSSLTVDNPETHASGTNVGVREWL